MTESARAPATTPTMIPAPAVAATAAEEEGLRLFSGGVARFERSAPALANLPVDDLPEVAFAGRSNVGKSSLLNALVQRRKLARASNTPGRTQELNLFLVGEPPRLRLVDMPGYGYADAPDAVVRRWLRLVGAYLAGRPNLCRTLLLVDGRHGLKPIDRGIMAALDKAAQSYQIVLTKADKVKPTELMARLVETETEARRHAAAYPKVLATSSTRPDGLDALRLAVWRAAFAGVWSDESSKSIESIESIKGRVTDGTECQALKEQGI